MSHEGKLAAVTNANGFVVEYAYDIMDRVTNISWKTASGATLGGFGYEYDSAGRLASTLSLSTQPYRVRPFYISYRG